MATFDKSSSPPTSYRVSPTQARMLLAHALVGADQEINLEQVVCRSTEKLDLPAFRQAWQMIINRHSALSVGFKRDENQQPFQEIHSPIELPISVVDRPVEAADREAFIEEWLRQDRQRPFDLSSPPLMRVTVLRLAENDVIWVWTFHHILMDGRSYLLVLEDFFSCHESLCLGRPVELPERKHFSEFVSWHQDWMAAEQKSAAAYWQELFAKDEPDSILSIGQTSAPTDHRQESLKLNLEANSAESLHRLARDFDLTVNTIMQGTWALLLSRYYRSKSVTFSTVRACRNGSIDGTEGMIGMLMNSLPVHVRIAEGMPAVDFLQGIRAQQRAVRPYQWTPWEIIRKSIPVATSKQFFDSCVLYERYNLAQEMTERFGKNGTRTFSLRERSNVLLLLLVTEKPQLQIELIYQSSVFEPEQIAQLGRSFLALLQHIVATPTQPVGALELLDASDKASLLKTLSGPALAVPEDKGLHQWFEDQARKTPHEIAVVGERSLTYEQLDREANELAARLLAMGVAADQLVMIAVPRSALALVAIFGVLKSGAAYLPTDVTMPKARLQNLIEEAPLVAVITEEAHTRALPAFSVPVVILEAARENLSPAPSQKLPKIRGSRLAYVISTSGTTGRPKLIGVEHRQAANLLAYATQILLQPEDVRCVPFIDALSGDSSISQIFTTLALGGTLVQVPEILEIKSSPFYEKFTCLGTIHSLLSILLNVTGLPPSVRFIGLGAETIPAELLQRLDAMPQIKKVFNYYGPSETTVYCTMAVLLDRSNPNIRIDMPNRGRVIGRPVANTRIYLVDDYGQLTPPGAKGEIYIAGDLVARGYLNAAGKDAENFLPDRFSTEPSERMYRSGDLAHLRTDGQLEFHGRKDHQMKFHGVRIEAAEIENALLSFPGVRQAVVDVRTEAEGRKRLVAYLVAEGGDFPKQKRRKILRLLLPGAMIPQHFVLVDRLPLTSVGKVDRAALARLDLSYELSVHPGAPASPNEQLMKEIWEQNLARSPLELDQDYFEMGGDSLSAVNLLLAIEKQFGARLKPQALLESSTIGELVQEVERSKSEKAAPPTANRTPLLPLQESGNRTPLILIPGGSGEHTLSYKKFAQNFFPHHPVHGLQSPYALMIEESADPIAFLSTHFAKQILGLVKDRPFVLFGHCVGGLLAWHVACALSKESAPPYKLVIYDSPVPHKGINVASLAREYADQSRFQQALQAYQLAWNDWRLRHGYSWRTKVGFLFWALNNFFMRKGLDRSEEGRDNFAKLAYLRVLQSCPLSAYPQKALLIYHRAQAEAVSRSRWHAHVTVPLQVEFVAGDHRNWERAILNTIPLLRQEIEGLEARQQAIAGNGHAPVAAS